MTGHLFVLTGPSGVGKTTIVLEILKQRDDLKRLVTCTSRPMREGEVDGKDYHFFTDAEFKQMIENDELFEWDHHYDRYYGIRKKDIEALLSQGNGIMWLDIAGTQTMKEKLETAVSIFVEPESVDELLRRLEKRGSSKASDYQSRIDAIEREMEYKPKADYVVTNRENELNTAINEVLTIIDRTS